MDTRPLYFTRPKTTEPVLPKTYFLRKVVLHIVMNWFKLPKHFKGGRCHLLCIWGRNFSPSLLDSNQVLQALSPWPDMLYVTLSMDVSPLILCLRELLQKVSCAHPCRCGISCEGGPLCFPFVNNLTAAKSE